MRNIFLLIAISISINTFSQSRLGFTEKQIKYEEFPDKIFQTKYTTEGSKYI